MRSSFSLLLLTDIVLYIYLVKVKTDFPDAFIGNRGQFQDTPLEKRQTYLRSTVFVCDDTPRMLLLLLLLLLLFLFSISLSLSLS